VFKTRSKEPERIDTGDYTPAEYERFLKEIAFINRHVGDSRALRKSLLDEIEHGELREFSVLDVGSGSGEMLRVIAAFARKTGRRSRLTGIDLNAVSSTATLTESHEFPEIESVRGTAMLLPFADGSFDYVISSLFFHHLSDDQIKTALTEISRVARRGIFVIDLHRHPLAFALYKLFCVAFRISPLVRHDGSLSILRAFTPGELEAFGTVAGWRKHRVDRCFPFRLVLRK